MKSQNIKLPSMRGKRVLITGGLGFIGSNLARECLALGAKVTIYDCLDPRSGGNMFNINGVKSDVRLLFHDILDFDQVCQGIAGQDLIFNCAASTSHPFSMREPWFDLDVNSRGVVNLLEAIRRFNTKTKLVHLGTTTQLGRLHYKPADENHSEFPMDISSANKFASEKYVLIYAHAYNIRATVLRLANTFGPRAQIHSADFTFNNYFVGLALQGKDVTVFGDGKQLRNVLYVDDAVCALILASQNTKTDGQTFFVAHDVHHSVAEIAQATVKHIGSGRVRFIDWPRGGKSVDVGDAVISNKKINRTLGWSPTWSLEAGLKRTRQYYGSCLQEYLR